jgi:hypothetical protein
MVTTPEPVTMAPTDTTSVTQTRRIDHGAVLRAIEGNTVNLPPFRHRAAAAAGQPGVVRWAGYPDGDRDHGMARRSAIGAGHLRIRQQYFRLLHDFGEAWRGPDCPPVDPGLAQSPVRTPFPWRMDRDLNARLGRYSRVTEPWRNGVTATPRTT